MPSHCRGTWLLIAGGMHCAAGGHTDGGSDVLHGARGAGGQTPGEALGCLTPGRTVETVLIYTLHPAQVTHISSTQHTRSWGASLPPFPSAAVMQPRGVCGYTRPCAPHTFTCLHKGLGSGYSSIAEKERESKSASRNMGRKCQNKNPRLSPTATGPREPSLLSCRALVPASLAVPEAPPARSPPVFWLHSKDPLVPWGQTLEPCLVWVVRQCGAACG